MNHYRLKNTTKKFRIIKITLIKIFIIFILSFRNVFSFEINEVAKGFFVHFGKQEDSNINNRGDIANIGFIVGKNSIAVIDTGGSPNIGIKLLKKIREISNLPISHLIITHEHPDHYFGTNAFIAEQPKIIGHEKLKRALITNFEFYRNLQFALIKENNIKEAKLILPDIHIKTGETMRVNLGDREIILKAWKSGHTDNDLSIYDEKTKFFWSENIFVDRIPSIRASIKGWRSNLEEIIKMDIDSIIPGHGPLKSKEEAIRPMIKYFDRLIKQTRSFHNLNKTLKNAQENIAKKNSENWVLFESYHISNVTKAYTELEWE